MTGKKTLILGFLGILMAAGMQVKAQDSIRVKSFDYSKLKPIVHFFANAEYNPSVEVSKDYSFWIGRLMLGFNYTFNSHWSTRILIDRTRLAGSINTMYVKVANLRWAPNERLAVEAGVVNQNNYIPFETFYGYRFVAETFQDRYYTIPSSDIGVVGYFRISRMLSMDAAVTNGEGPRIDQDNFGRLRLAGGVNFFPISQVHLRLFYQVKSSGEPGNTATDNLVNAFAAVTLSDRVRFGTDITYIKNYLSIPGVNTYGGTVFGCFSLYKTFNYLVRFNRLVVDSQPEPTPGYPFSQNALITGFSVSPAKGITLCLNYQGAYPLDKLKSANHRVLFSFEYKI